MTSDTSDSLFIPAVEAPKAGEPNAGKVIIDGHPYDVETIREFSFKLGEAIKRALCGGEDPRELFIDTDTLVDYVTETGDIDDQRARYIEAGQTFRLEGYDEWIKATHVDQTGDTVVVIGVEAPDPEGD